MKKLSIINYQLSIILAFVLTLAGCQKKVNLKAEWEALSKNAEVAFEQATTPDEANAVVTNLVDSTYILLEENMGAEYSDSPDYDALRPDPSKINILMLHGQMTENPSVVDYGIDVRRLRGKHIDYLALGHLHSHREGILDERGIFCYPGCPEGRGFDECEGEHGLILLETDATTHTLSHTFIPFENRRLFSFLNSARRLKAR